VFRVTLVDFRCVRRLLGALPCSEHSLRVRAVVGQGWVLRSALAGGVQISRCNAEELVWVPRIGGFQVGERLKRGDKQTKGRAEDRGNLCEIRVLREALRILQGRLSAHESSDGARPSEAPPSGSGSPF
jgi:hypothetical protein